MPKKSDNGHNPRNSATSSGNPGGGSRDSQAGVKETMEEAKKFGDDVTETKERTDNLFNKVMADKIDKIVRKR